MVGKAEDPYALGNCFYYIFLVGALRVLATVGVSVIAVKHFFSLKLKFIKRES